LAIGLAVKIDFVVPDKTVPNLVAETDEILDSVKQLAFFAAATIASLFIRLLAYPAHAFAISLALAEDPPTLEAILDEHDARRDGNDPPSNRDIVADWIPDTIDRRVYELTFALVFANAETNSAELFAPVVSPHALATPDFFDAPFSAPSDLDRPDSIPQTILTPTFDPRLMSLTAPSLPKMVTRSSLPLDVALTFACLPRIVARGSDPVAYARMPTVCVVGDVESSSRIVSLLSPVSWIKRSAAPPVSS